MKIKKLTTCALLTAIALTIWVAESYIPPLTPVPGIKLGLANIVTIFTAYYLGGSYAVSVLTLRVVLGLLLTGQVSAALYAAPAGVGALLLTLLLKMRMKEELIWVVSGLSALVHNAIQLGVAVLITGSTAILIYMPLLAAAGLIAGTFTGLCAKYTLKIMRRTGE